MTRFFFFFFSSRRRHTRCGRDWSSDVCSSDLVTPTPFSAHAGIEYLFIAVVGGAGYVWGAVLGAGIVVILKELLQSYLPYIFGGKAQLETIVFGILLVLLLQLAPSGVWPWLMSWLPFKTGRKHPDTALTLPARERASAEPEVLLHIERA